MEWIHQSKYVKGKTRPNYVLSTEDSSLFWRQTQAQNKGMEDDTPSNSSHNKVSVSLLIADKTDFESKVTKDKCG